MSSGANGEWVRQGTPRDDNADWNEEQSEYGTAVSPTEWDDYSSEQSVPVAAPRPQAFDGAATASSPSPTEREYQAVPGQEPDAGEEYRSEESDADVEDSPAGDPDDSGFDPAQSGHDHVDSQAVADESVDQDSLADAAQTTRPRPIVPDASAAAVGAAVPAHVEDSSVPSESEGSEERHFEAAEYLAVSPEPVPATVITPEAADVDEVPGDATHDHDVAHEGERSLATSVEDAPENESANDSEVLNDEAEENTVQERNDEDLEATQVVPVTTPAVNDAESSTETTGNIPDGLYRADGAETTAVIAPEAYPDVDVEEERLQARLEAERQAREQRLGAVPTSSDNALRDDAGPARVNTDRFLPSFALFVLRLVTAAILGATSWLILGNGVDATANFLGGYPIIPEPRLVAWILGFTLGAMALLLVIGLLQRVVGFLLLVVAVAALVLIRWGNFPIFVADVEGFIGDKDLLLAAVGLVLLAIGGGRWGIDGAFRASRAASKAEREG